MLEQKFTIIKSCSEKDHALLFIPKKKRLFEDKNGKSWEGIKKEK